MDILSNIANVLQIITFVPFKFMAARWAMKSKYSIAVWALVAVIGASALVSAAALAERAGWFAPKPEIVQGRHYDNETVVLDNHRFYDCTFERTTLQYGGGSIFMNDANKFIGPQSFIITNPAATNILGLLLRFGILEKQAQASLHLGPHKD